MVSFFPQSAHFSKVPGHTSEMFAGATQHGRYELRSIGVQGELVIALDFGARRDEQLRRKLRYDTGSIVWRFRANRNSACTFGNADAISDVDAVTWSDSATDGDSTTDGNPRSDSHAAPACDRNSGRDSHADCNPEAACSYTRANTHAAADLGRRRPEMFDLVSARVGHAIATNPHQSHHGLLVHRLEQKRIFRRRRSYEFALAR